MPWSYQGRLSRKALDAHAAHTLGEHVVTGLSDEARRDIWLSWDHPDCWRLAEAITPPGYDGFWLDVTARPTLGALDALDSWAHGLRGGRLVLRGLAEGRENEIHWPLPGTPPRRVDDERFDPFRALRERGSVTVRYVEECRGAPSAARLRIAAQRVASAYERARAALDSRGPTAAEWLAAQSALPPPRSVGGRLGTGLAVPDGARPDAEAGADGLPVAPLIELWRLGDAPFGVQVTVPAAHLERLPALFAAWADLIEPVHTISIQCHGVPAELHAVADLLEPVGNARDAYGLSTLCAAQPPAQEMTQALLDDATLRSRAEDWGLRWWTRTLNAALPPGAISLFAGVERDRYSDRARVRFELDDPDALSLARRRLGGVLDRAAEQPGAWTYEGPTTASATGRIYQTLHGALQGAVTDAITAPTPAPLPVAHPAVRWLAQRVRRGGDLSQLPTLAREAFQRHLPQFVFDRTAHATDRHFMAFTCATPEGHQLIELEWLFRPAGHRLHIGCAVYRVRLGDLIPSEHEALPGHRLPFGTLLPERPDAEWRYRTASEAAGALDESAALLAARAIPYFDAARAALGVARAALSVTPRLADRQEP